MAKYMFECKRQIVMDYSNGGGMTQFLAKIYGVPSHAQIQRWMTSYKEFGDAGWMRSRKNNNYTFACKLPVVELCLSTEVSYQELA